MVTEGCKAREIIGEKTVLKIPAILVGFQVLAALSPEISCSVTTIYPDRGVTGKTKNI
jgi:transaldolase